MGQDIEEVVMLDRGPSRDSPFARASVSGYIHGYPQQNLGFSQPGYD